jgi:hypothetical protein
LFIRLDVSDRSPELHDLLTQPIGQLFLSRIIGFILVNTSDIHAGKDYLEYYHCPSSSVPAPDDPKHIAQQEAPKADHAPNLSLRANEPGGANRHDHCRPLKCI